MESQIKQRLQNDRLDWNLLKTFMVIANERSITRAAGALHVTQPAVSQALKRLESQLGQVLIVRSGSHFEITKAGLLTKKLAEEVYSHISHMAALESESDDRDISGFVRMLVVSGIVSTSYDEFLVNFHRSSPRIDLQIQVMKSADIVSALLQKSATAGISPDYRLPKKIMQSRFIPQKFAFYCGKHHHLYGRTDLTVDDLRTENIVSVSGDTIGGNFSKLTLFREQNGFSGRVVAFSGSMTEVRRLIFTGFGIGCLPEDIANSDLMHENLFRLPPSEGIGNVDLHLLWNGERNYSPAEMAFLEGLRNHIAQTSNEARSDEGNLEVY
jgi:DNA-binding transcriptional LysR family regulator